MRKRILISLLAINGLLGLALAVETAKTQILPLSFLDCCKMEGETPYCCQSCCWFTDDCQEHHDCRVEETDLG